MVIKINVFIKKSYSMHTPSILYEYINHMMHQEIELWSFHPYFRSEQKISKK